MMLKTPAHTPGEASLVVRLHGERPMPGLIRAGGPRQAGRKTGPSHPTDADLWRHGVALFNQGRYFECHECWETLWKRATGRERIFYQAMIQSAAALLHASRGNWRGAASLWKKASKKLETFGSSFRGIAIGTLLTQIECCIDRTQASSRSMPGIRQTRDFAGG
jgi:predicted metal-dependent hydrolase